MSFGRVYHEGLAERRLERERAERELQERRERGEAWCRRELPDLVEAHGLAIVMAAAELVGHIARNRGPEFTAAAVRRRVEVQMARRAA